MANHVCPVSRYDVESDNNCSENQQDRDVDYLSYAVQLFAPILSSLSSVLKLNCP